MRVVHVNMQRFGGGTAARNAAYQQTLQILAAESLRTGGDIQVAGLTEITNAGAAPQAAADLLNTLGLNQSVTIWTGRTAVGNTDEYITIGWKTRGQGGLLTVSHVGLAHRTGANAGNWAYASRPWANRLQLRNARPHFQPDSRGVASVIGTIQLQGGDGQEFPFAFGFMHNMCTIGNLTGDFAALPGVAQLIRNQYNNPDIEIIFGGDFNVAPHQVALHHGGPQLFFCAGKTQTGAYIPTTDGGNTYDYWLVSDQRFVTPPAVGRLLGAAFVLQQTRGNLRSDHAMIALYRTNKP